MMIQFSMQTYDERVPTPLHSNCQIHVGSSPLQSHPFARCFFSTALVVSCTPPKLEPLHQNTTKIACAFCWFIDTLRDVVYPLLPKNHTEKRFIRSAILFCGSKAALCVLLAT
jgi:hypothetical protein